MSLGLSHWHSFVLPWKGRCTPKDVASLVVLGAVASGGGGAFMVIVGRVFSSLLFSLLPPWCGAHPGEGRAGQILGVQHWNVMNLV